MTKQITNIRNIEVNDIVQLTYNCGTVKNLLVKRVEDKSWYYNNNARSSYGTLERLFANKGDVIKCEIIKAKI
jgi:hypothetical protein